MTSSSVEDTACAFDIALLSLLRATIPRIGWRAGYDDAQYGGKTFFAERQHTSSENTWNQRARGRILKTPVGAPKVHRWAKDHSILSLSPRVTDCSVL